MPLVEVSLTAGRDPNAIRELITQVHNAVVVSIDANPESVRVIIREVPRTHWAVGGETLAERDSAAESQNVALEQSNPLDRQKERL